MPPKKDEELEDRILKAAQRLWRAHGATGLTLRAVARAAKTTTPTVYKRFKNKEAIQVALARRLRDELNAECFSAKTLEEVCQRYVRFAEQRPHDYELLWHTWTEIFHPDVPRPGRAWFLAQLANRFGGEPEEYGNAFYGLFLLSHAAATLLTISGDEKAHAELQRNFSRICDKVLQNIVIFRE